MKSCRICGRELELRADPDCPRGWVDRLAAMPMCCSMCGEYGWKRLNLREAMQRVGIAVVAAGNAPTERQKKYLLELLKRYGRLTFTYYRQSFQWDDAWAEMVLAKPWEILKRLSELEEGVAGMAGRKPVNAEPLSYRGG